MAKVTWRGVTLDAQTRDMLVEVDKLVGPNIPIRPVQGSYSHSVGASAGTHSGGGAVDISVRVLTSFQINLVVFLLRRVGFAAWHRLPGDGPWAEHIHAIAIGVPDLSSQAKAQVSAYKAGLNGLANHHADRDAPLGAPRTATWDSYLRNWPAR